MSDLDTIIKGELSRHISGLAKLKLLLEKEMEQQNERIRSAKQRLKMTEDTQKEEVFVLENQKPSDNSGLKFLEGNSEVAEITDELLDARGKKLSRCINNNRAM